MEKVIYSKKSRRALRPYKDLLEKVGGAISGRPPYRLYDFQDCLFIWKNPKPQFWAGLQAKLKQLCHPHFLSNLLSERRAGDAADAGFFQRNIHLVADFTHGKDDFVRRDS